MLSIFSQELLQFNNIMCLHLTQCTLPERLDFNFEISPLLLETDKLMLDAFYFFTGITLV
jgi:hypothetical protein